MAEEICRGIIVMGGGDDAAARPFIRSVDLAA